MYIARGETAITALYVYNYSNDSLSLSLSLLGSGSDMDAGSQGRLQHNTMYQSPKLHFSIFGLRRMCGNDISTDLHCTLLWKRIIARAMIYISIRRVDYM